MSLEKAGVEAALEGMRTKTSKCVVRRSLVIYYRQLLPLSVRWMAGTIYLSSPLLSEGLIEPTGSGCVDIGLCEILLVEGIC